MARKSASQVVEKYRRNMSTAGQDYKEGVENPKQDWETATRNAEGRWRNGVQQAISDGAFSKGTQGKNEKWRNRTATIGVDRYTSVAGDAAEEFGKVVGDVLDIAYASSDRVRAMPGDTYEQRKAKATANMDYIREQWRARKGRA